MANGKLGWARMVEDLKCASSLHGRVVHYAAAPVCTCVCTPSPPRSRLLCTRATRNVTMHATESRSHCNKTPKYQRAGERNFMQCRGHFRDKTKLCESQISCTVQRDSSADWWLYLLALQISALSTLVFRCPDQSIHLQV